MTERRPKNEFWSRLDLPSQIARNVHPGEENCFQAASLWAYKRRIWVLSTLDFAELPGGRGDSGLQWHISVTRRGARQTATDVLKALRAFGLVGAEEDNHHPGAARHFWLVVDPARRVTCDCKEDEVTVREPDGYTWTNPQPGEGECRGCEMQKLLGKACPIHGASEGATT